MAADFDMDGYKKSLSVMKPKELKERKEGICRNGMPQDGLRKEMLDAVNAELKSRRLNNGEEQGTLFQP